jgi:Ca2+-binding RTX toxin-like protein
MSGTQPPSVDALELALDTPQNLAFRPFASIDLSGGSVLMARIVVASGLVATAGATALLDEPGPGFTTFFLTATETEALEAELEALAFTFLDPVAPGDSAQVDFSLVITGGTAEAPVDRTAAITVHVGEPDEPTTITGTLPPVTLPDFGWSFAPFIDATVADGDTAALLTLTLTWEAGELTLLGSLAPTVDLGGVATLVLTGAAAAVNTALQGLMFVPVSNLAAPGSAIDSTITLVARDDIRTDSVTATVAVTATGVQDAPTLTGLIDYAMLTDQQTLLPFGAIDLEDPDAEAGVVGAQTLTATVTLSDPANGTLGGVFGGAFDAGTGVWTFSGSTGDVEAALLALVFTPTLHQVPAGEVVTTTFVITVSDGIDTVLDTNTVADVTASAIAITLDQEVLDLGTLAEGQTTANIAALLLANARTAIPGNEAYLYILGAFNDGTQGIATFDFDTQIFRFEADGFNALSPTDSFQYLIADGRGGLVTGTARFTITGPTLPTLVGTDGPDALTLPGWNGRVIGQRGDDTIVAGGGDNRIFGGWGDDRILARGFGNYVEGGPGADTINAGEGNATVDGGDGHNVVTMRGSRNVVSAGDGDNFIYGTFSDSTVTFGDGNNRVALGGHNNLILLGHGDNSIVTGDGNATVMAGDGDNTIIARGHGNHFSTGAGRDDITAGPGNSWIQSGGGNDIIRLGNGFQHRIEAGAGDDTVNAPRGGGGNHTIDLGLGNDIAGLIGDSSTVMGGDGHDRITVTGNWNLVDGGDGADTITGQRGEDNTLRGAEGDDRIVTGGGTRSRLEGGNGADTLISAAGADTLDGGEGADSLNGGDNDDVLLGGAGDDVLRGGFGRDRMEGGLGNDTYFVDNPGDTVSEAGGGGHDHVLSSMVFTLGEGIEDLTLLGTRHIAGQGNMLANRIAGNAGDNMLLGLQGADTLLGGAGNDTLVGHAGADVLNGGPGADVFRYARPGDGGDRILGFSVADDTIEVTGRLFGGLDAGADLGTLGLFAVGATATVAGQFTYDAATGVLAYDSNGATAGGVSVLATLSPGLAFTAADIVVI